MSDEHTSKALKSHIKGLYGSCIGITTAAKPAALPAECSGPLPDSCPTTVPLNLRALNTIRAPPVWNALPGVVNANPSSAVMVCHPTLLSLCPFHSHSANSASVSSSITFTDVNISNKLEQGAE
jgi:hypothetical protein